MDPDELDTELERACRAAVGDALRSITYFTADDSRQVYLREDLERDADVPRFVANERLGFTSQDTYGGSELGEYKATVRIFSKGYLTRVIVEEHGVFVTTDEVSTERFTEIAEALQEILSRA